MSSTITPSSPAQTLALSRGWLIFGGIFSIFVGFIAIGSPLIFSIVIAQLLGIFALVSGVISIFLAIFGKNSTHRVLEAVFGLIRIAAGIVLLACLASSVAVITLILAIFLAVEGAVAIVGAIQLRGNAGWVWTMINGIAALALGIMIYYRWPNDSAVVLGSFFGIYSLFSGMSRLMLGLSTAKA
ncbi:MAG: HdeD family acid-resistance protein [Chthoniobacterales bacterium]